MNLNVDRPFVLFKRVQCWIRMLPLVNSWNSWRPSANGGRARYPIDILGTYDIPNRYRWLHAPSYLLSADENMSMLEW